MLLRIACNGLALCATAAQAGAMMLMWPVLDSLSRGHPPAVFLDRFAASVPMIGQFMVLLAGLGALGLLASLWLDWRDDSARLAWIGALLCLAGLGLITFVGESPLNRPFAAQSLPPDQVRAALDRWLTWHLGRVLLGFCGAALGVVALVVRRRPLTRRQGQFYETEDSRRSIRGS